MRRPLNSSIFVTTSLTLWGEAIHREKKHGAYCRSDKMLFFGLRGWHAKPLPAKRRS